MFALTLQERRRVPFQHQNILLSFADFFGSSLCLPSHWFWRLEKDSLCQQLWAVLPSRLVLLISPPCWQGRRGREDVSPEQLNTPQLVTLFLLLLPSNSGLLARCWRSTVSSQVWPQVSMHQKKLLPIKGVFSLSLQLPSLLIPLDFLPTAPISRGCFPTFLHHEKVKSLSCSLLQAILPIWSQYSEKPRFSDNCGLLKADQAWFRRWQPLAFCCPLAKSWSWT